MQRFLPWRPLLLGLALAVLVPGGSAAAETFAFFGPDLEPAPIVLFEHDLPLTREAVEELAECVERVCGVRPAIHVGAPDPVPERAVWVGLQPEVERLFPGLDFDFQHPEEILIAASGSHLVIAGRDRWDPAHLVVEGNHDTIEGRQLEYGTANAVYTFLQERLGVRWFWPGEDGADYPELESLAFAPFEHRHHPVIRGRGGVLRYSALGNRGYGKSHDWTRRQRLQLDSLDMSGGHGFGDWWERFHETQPELFALQPNGKRDGHPRPRNAKLCQSNPAVWDQWIRDVEAQLERDPNLAIFNGSPNDSWSSGHCVCEDCRAWDHPDGEPRLMHWHHHREERPALSDRHVTFANRLGERLRERFPDKDYRVSMLSYGHSRPAPVEARPSDKVLMSIVANFLGRTDLVDRGSTRGTTYRDQFKAWGELGIPLTWRPNTGSPAGWQQGLPDLSVAQTVEDMRLVASGGCIGIYIDSVWEHWATHGPQYYIMGQLAWNPEADAEAILADYYARAFGPAGEPVRAYYEILEAARMAYVDEHGYGTGPYRMPRLYDENLLSRSREHLNEAKARVSKGPEKYRDRVAFVRVGLDYTGRLVETIGLMAAYWRTRESSLADKALENWETMERLVEARPRAINWGPVRPATPRMIGLHPDHPNPKWKPDEVDDLDQR
ncbi:MAG: DUF4838 domain-containing protein [Verrucomicrobiales bacterium]